MGTDIHLIVEQKKECRWMRVPHFDRPCSSHYCVNGILGEEVPNVSMRGKPCWRCEGAGHCVQPHYADRSYDVFAMLANVRNGTGFAGSDSGDGFEPLSAARGIPEDLSEPLGFDEDGEDVDWLGDHSFTWLLWSELQDPAYWAKTTVKRGIVAAEQFLVYHEKGKPDSWCLGIWGPGVRQVTNAEMARLVAEKAATKDVYTRVSWTVTYGEQAAGFLQAITEVVHHIGDPPATDVRLVMGFDS